MAVQRPISFQESVRQGEAYEDKVYRYLAKNGWNIMKTGRQGKCLDFLINKNEAMYWVDVKSQTTSSRGQTGIRLEHFQQYCRIQKETRIPAILIMVILTGEHTGVWLLKLNTKCDHTAQSKDRTGPCMMIYWNMSDLKKIGKLSILD